MEAAGKIILVLNHFFIANTAVPWRVIFTLVVLSRFLPSLQKFQFPIVPILVFMAYRETLFISLWWVFYLGALAPFLFLALPASQRPGRELFFHFWIPSVLGAFLVGWTSASSPINGSLTMVPAAFVSVICLIAPIPLGQMKWRKMVYLFTLGSALFCQFGGKAFYRDGNWERTH